MRRVYSIGKAVQPLGLAAVVCAIVFGAALWSAPAAEAQERASQTQIRDLLLALVRYGEGEEVDLDLTYLPPVYFKTIAGTPPAVTKDRPTFVFFMLESVHSGLLPEDPVHLLLQVDDGALLEPFEINIIDGYDPHHRTVEIMFPAPANIEALLAEGAPPHAIKVVSPYADGSVDPYNTFTWELPLDLSKPEY